MAEGAWKPECKLEHGHADTAKVAPGWERAPTKEQILAWLAACPALMREVCAMYAIDIVCFGSRVPKGCEALFAPQEDEL